MSYQPDFLGKMTEKKQDNYILYVCGPEACREIEQVPGIVVRKMYRSGRKMYREKTNCRETALICKLAQIVLHTTGEKRRYICCKKEEFIMNKEKLPFEMPSLDLTGKVAVVTGGTKGLGYGIVMTLAYHGAKVVITSRHQNDCDAVAQEVIDMGGEAMGIKTDVQNTEEIQNLIDKTVERFGKVDIMINNAGVAPKVRADLLEMKSVYFGSQIAAKQMIAQGEGGKIINMCSIGGIKGNNQLSTYGASKAGAINLTKSMAWELGRYNINVNAICPGYVETALNTEALNNPKFREKTLKGIPLRRFGTVQEIAALTLFLASDCCNMITGEYIVADMGATLGGNV